MNQILKIINKFEGKGIEYYENGKIEYIKDFKIQGKEVRFNKKEKYIMQQYLKMINLRK